MTRMLHLSLPPDSPLAHEHPVPDAVVATIAEGMRTGELSASVSPGIAAEIVTGTYFDTLSRRLMTAEAGAPAPFDLAGRLAQKLDVILAGLSCRAPGPGAEPAGRNAG
ncbi:hypothetical protein [Streptomyces sp. NBC_01497]|uniref:hypothetical protein n=1 Tax=Streptomyces sp. NBC_01497 TaxID=2903885 RepID=UPI002E30356A|nr:hypothetical protein [Streptomyces sp. NBC_01497]